MNNIWKLFKCHTRLCLTFKRGLFIPTRCATTSKLCFLPLVYALDLSGRNKIEIPNQKDLSHEHLIQQAASVSVNAATQLLTQTIVAIVDILDSYKQALLELMSLMEESQNGVVQVSNVNDSIIALRSKASKYKEQLMDLESLLEYVEKVVMSTAETSFLIGAEFVSTTLTERLHNIKFQLEEKRREVAQIETECLTLQKKIIVDTKD